jgi:hypothetical protein
MMEHLTRTPLSGAVIDRLTSGLLKGFPDAARMASQTLPLLSSLMKLFQEAVLIPSLSYPVPPVK